jgi:1,4-dihydroxy-2-naphthoate octaprenyltransferase
MSDHRPPASALRLWGTAVRPFAYTASVLAVLLGLALSRYAGHATHWWRFGLTLLGVACFHTAANLLNDAYDHRRGLDTEVQPTSGAVVRGWLTERQVLRAALLFLAIGVVCGLLLVWQVGWVVLLLGVLGSGFALGYTRAGVCLKYAGLGDLTVFASFGVLPVFGTYWVQARAFSWLPILWSLPLVSLTVAILHANNWRDIDSDTRKGCQTVANRLGEHGSELYYRVLVLMPFALVVLYLLLSRVPALAGLAPGTVLLVLPAWPLALRLLRVRRDSADGAFAMLDAKTAQHQLIVGSLLVLAFLLAPFLAGGGRW